MCYGLQRDLRQNSCSFITCGLGAGLTCSRVGARRSINVIGIHHASIKNEVAVPHFEGGIGPVDLVKPASRCPAGAIKYTHVCLHRLGIQVGKALVFVVLEDSNQHLVHTML